MQSNRLFDEFARMTTDAIGAAQGVKREAEAILRGRAEKLVRDMDFASNEEVQALREMVLDLKKQNEALTARVNELETATPKPTAKSKVAK